MMLQLNPELEAKLKDIAAQSGQRVDELVENVMASYVEGMTHSHPDYQRAQEAAARIRELQKHVKPDPEGWTIRDYINHGRP